MKKATNVLYYMRKRHGLTQNELARAITLTANDICRIESGNSGAGIEKFITLAKYFSIPLNALMLNDLSELCSSLKDKPKTTRRLLKHFQKVRQQCDEIGCLGEDWVCQQEITKLQGTVYENAINQNFADDEDAHFDILSFDTDGTPICIEVKTTTGELDKTFFISADELELAYECLKCGIRYEIHRVFNVNDPKKCERVIIPVDDLLNNYTFKPITYMVNRKAAS